MPVQVDITQEAPYLYEVRPPKLIPDARIGRFSSWQWNAGLVLLVGALIASVVIPARATRRIVVLIEDISDVIEPARLLCMRLQSGVSAEQLHMSSYASGRDSGDLARYERQAAQTDQDVGRLSELVDELGAPVTIQMSEVAREITGWRALNRTVDGASRDAVGLERSRQVEGIQRRITVLQGQLAAEAKARRANAFAAGRLSIESNIELVLAALAALAAVMMLTHRERRLIGVLADRAARESSLRETSEALSGAFTAEEVAAEIARSAMSVVHAHGAFVAHEEPGGMHVRAVAGVDLVPIGSPVHPTRTVAECVRDAREPSIHGVEALGWTHAADNRQVILVPLHHTLGAVGALFIVTNGGAAHLDEDLAWARTFAHIAALAYEKVRLLEAEREARRQLEAVMDGRSRLMRGFSHDVKNPLGAADGFAELLLTEVYGPLSPPQAESVARVRRSIHVALRLIDDLHDFVRAEAGQITLRPTETDIAELVGAISAQYAASAGAKGLTLSVTVPTDLPTIVTDGARLSQVMSNMLSNAIKYTDSGSVYIDALAQTGPDGTSGICMRVGDTGPGIPADRQELIFEEFSRLDPDAHPGAGLGLAISRLIAHLMGGEITVESDGAGSVFSLWIPLAPAGYIPPTVA